jgi:hemolysin III
MNQVVVPKLRGWFHLGATPIVIIASLVLFILSKESLKFAVSIYAVTAIMLFSVSAIYHRVPWVPSKKMMWRRWDHANINLLIAGSYTPFAVALLEGRERNILLSVVWLGALFGVGLRIFWINAPRWLYVGNYLLLGWVAVAYRVAYGCYSRFSLAASFTQSERFFMRSSDRDGPQNTSVFMSYSMFLCSQPGFLST